MKLCSQSEGTLPSRMIAAARSWIMEAPMSLAARIISTTMPDRPCALPAFICEIVGGWVVRRCHVSFVTRGVQLILAYSWARPAILVAGKGREVMFLFLLFLHFHSCFSFFPVPPFHLFCYLFCLFSPFLWETTQNDPQGLTCR